jgi:protein-tyrosine-phosphatase
MLYRFRNRSLGIWGLALGYFIAYTPYSGLTKALSMGLWPGLTGPVSGLTMLPASVMATAGGMLAFISWMGWWKHAGRRQFFGRSIPFPRLYTFLSGLCMATIMGTTTLAFTFTGISILFVLVLLRGGILAMGPVVDALCKRKVRWFSWAAMVLSFASLAVMLGDVRGYRLTIIACADVAAYLAAYFIRLQYMSRLAKSNNQNVAYCYFVEEQMVASPALLAILALLALIGVGPMVELRQGFTTFLVTPEVVPAFIVGLCYATLCVFTTLIFLDHRENTFCIPMHCCSSMLSGVLAAYVLASGWSQPLPSDSQLTGAGILVIAIACLSFPALRSAWQYQVCTASVGVQRFYLFVCGGNTSRSPMAQAICNHEIRQLLGLKSESGLIQAVSAGLTAKPGSPFTELAVATLRHLAVDPHEHASREVTAELIEQAEVVFCMTEDQRRQLAKRFPAAEVKIQRLDPDNDIEDPSGKDQDIYLKVAVKLQDLIRKHVPVLVG